MTEIAAGLQAGGEIWFREHFTEPHLVLLGDLSEIHDEALGEKTVLDTPSDLGTRVHGGHRVPRDARVWVLRKFQDNFPAKITLGRANNNDVVVAHPTISKFHAYFAPHDGGMRVIEAGSKNSSRVNGRRITTELKPQELSFGDTLHFGAAPPLLYCDPDRLLAILQRHAGS